MVKKTRATRVLRNGYCAFITRFKLKNAERARSADVHFDDRDRQMRDKLVNAQFEAELAIWHRRLAALARSASNRMNRINIVDNVCAKLDVFVFI